jgi:phage terminase small subunit
MPETLATRAGKCTPKEAKFARELVKTGVQRTAALRAYETNSIQTADKIAYVKLQKSRVRAEIARITQAVNLKEINQDTWRSAIVEGAFQGTSDPVKYKYRELGAKVWNLLNESPTVHQNIQLNNVNVGTAEPGELQKALMDRLKLNGKVRDIGGSGENKS